MLHRVPPARQLELLGFFPLPHICVLIGVFNFILTPSCFRKVTEKWSKQGKINTSDKFQ